MQFILVKMFIAIFGLVIARSVESAFQAREERSLASSDTNSTDEIVVTVQLSFTDYTNADIIPALNVTASQGTTAFQLLNLAAEQNPCYLFQYITYQTLGHYITTICCVEQNTTSNFYWFVYLNNTLSPVGVDLIIPNNGDILKFEYRFINSTGMEKEVQMISVSVELKFTNYPNPNVIPTQQITATNGTSAFEFLGLAGQSNPCYHFEYTQFSFGRYITTICCVKENKTTNLYWFIYINNQLSPVGADLLMPKDGDTLKFEYQLWKSNSTGHTQPNPTTINENTAPNPTNAMNKTAPSLKHTKPKGKGHKTFVQNFIIYLSLVIGVLGWKFNDIA